MVPDTSYISHTIYICSGTTQLSNLFCIISQGRAVTENKQFLNQKLDLIIKAFQSGQDTELASAVRPTEFIFITFSSPFYAHIWYFCNSLPRHFCEV